MNWTAQSFSFLAGGPSTTITFTTNGTAQNVFGPALDNVSAVAVPEPAAWAMMLAGFGLVGGAMRRRERSRTVLA